ncbi:MAG TPA: two-component regulator propeller domain-containing protein, partial [Verrucomicrobiae bacterium]|nr:two-component regulator propeller domain-containing protein [Verrucomicrobiae bacterium]
MGVTARLLHDGGIVKLGLTGLKRPALLSMSLNRLIRALSYTRARVWLGACLLFAASAISASAAGAKYTVDVWGTDKGLPEGAVISMVQTRDGYLWLGTLKGLARFDGIHFTVFNERNTPELNAGEIVHLFEDSEGNLWVGTQSAGVVLVKGGRVISLPELNWRTYEQRVVAACEGPPGTVWLANPQGQLFQYSNGQGRVANAPTNAPTGISLRAMAMEKSGVLWVGFASELIGYDTHAGAMATNTVIHQTPPPGSLDFLLASSRGGCWRFVNGRIEKWVGAERLGDAIPYPWNPSVRVSTACEDEQGNLIVGTLGAGLFWFDSQGKSTCISTNGISTNDRLSNNSIYSLLMDREGSLWVGTDGGGLDRVKRKVFDVLEESRGHTVKSVAEDTNGGLWIGFNVWGNDTNQAGVAYSKGTNFQRYALYHNASALSVLVDRQQRVWAGASGVLFTFQDQGFQLVLPEGQSVDRTVSELYAGQSNRLWVGMRTGLGLLRWDDQSWWQFTMKDGLSSDDVRALAEDHAGNLWIGTRGGGLDRFRDGKFTAFHKQDGLPSDNISSLYVDDQDVLWVGTDGCGLARFQGNSWTNYTTEDGLTSDSIGYLVEDGEGFFWIGSNTGLMRVRKQELNDFA